jgi:hypothetical protein
LTRSGKATETVAITESAHLYALEIDAVGEALNQGRLECAFMPVADTLGNMAALDAWRESIGLVYDSEQPFAAR